MFLKFLGKRFIIKPYIGLDILKKLGERSCLIRFGLHRTQKKPFDHKKALKESLYQTITVKSEAGEYFVMRILNVDGDAQCELREYKYHKEKGEPYDIYVDGLKIHSTLDSRMQAYAEWAVQEHLKYDLQEDFFTNSEKWKRPPFSNDLTETQIDTLMERAKRRSQLYKVYVGKICGYCETAGKICVEGR